MDREVLLALAEALGGEIVCIHPVHGGDVASSYGVTLSDGRKVFAKTHRDPPPGFFQTESEGLRWLRASQTVRVPRVLAVSDDPPYLALEWIEEGRPTADTDQELGWALAALRPSRLRRSPRVRSGDDAAVRRLRRGGVRGVPRRAPAGARLRGTGGAAPAGTSGGARDQVRRRLRRGGGTGVAPVPVSARRSGARPASVRRNL